jgi:hypothetical protein
LKKLTVAPRYLFLSWILCAGVILTVDYFTGPYMRFPLLFVVPVSLAAWFEREPWAYFLAVTLPVIRMEYESTWGLSGPALYGITNAVIRAVALMGYAYLVGVVAKQNRTLSQRVNALEAVLPICSFCKQIRDENDNWCAFEEYVEAHSGTRFSHGFCPRCAEKHYGGVLKQVPD